jgi:hypothetical protein
MKSLFFAFVAATILAGTLAGGWLHGQASSRWGSHEALRLAADKLRRPLGSQLGNWRLVADKELADDVVQMLQCRAHIHRTYTHDQTGDSVSVAVMLGPPGPIAVHTPEICYSSQGFLPSGQRSHLTMHDRAGREHSLWDVRMEPHEVNGAPLRVLYGWGTGSAWAAEENPRFEYAGSSYLYKIQAAALVGDTSGEYDPCLDFLEAFLAELQENLVPQEATVSSSLPAS